MPVPGDREVEEDQMQSVKQGTVGRRGSRNCKLLYLGLYNSFKLITIVLTHIERVS